MPWLSSERLTAWHNLAPPARVPGQVTGDHDQLRVVAGGRSPIAVTEPARSRSSCCSAMYPAVGGERLGSCGAQSARQMSALPVQPMMFRPGRCPGDRLPCHTLPGCLVSMVRASAGRERDVVRVLVAGGSGAIGRRLVPQLVARGHQVTATTTSAGKLGLLEQLGAEGVVMDGLDAVSVGEAVAAAGPDVIVHQMTALSVAHAGKPDFRHPERFGALTNRLRTEGTDHLLAAAEATGVSRVVAQSVATWPANRDDGLVTEEERLAPRELPAKMRIMAEPLRHVEDVVVKAGGTVLRYGAFYGPGGGVQAQIELVRKRRLPIVGGGTGYFSWVHLDDAAGATVLAVEQRVSGVFNIVDDDPAPVSEWLPHLAACLGAKRPLRIPAWLIRPLAGEMGMAIMTQGRPFSNAKAKRELGWTLRYPTWREGFKEEA